ncbi:LpqN/LpqT family lipoprotein [Salinibacterium sp. ZJ450]|uniref:LpqN/LpqT family lipoprotein n=1 Tax=Salinibacterium sp. ZJ450 TaxID=2708338 RepID=UPI0014225D1B|nr:LpqN/LpqT family lipoprotein [Salinibacterium sp. ZJ450]
MSQFVSYPSAAFPAPPALGVDAPDGWSALVVENTVLAVGLPSEPGVFTPNVCVSVSRVPGIHELDESVHSVVSAYEALDDFAEIGRESREVFGRPGFRIEGSFGMPSVGAVYQAAHLTVVQQGTVTHVINAVATCAAPQAPELVPVLRAILDSLRGVDERGVDEPGLDEPGAEEPVSA